MRDEVFNEFPEISTERLKLRELIAIIKPDNTPSRLVIDKLGFKYVNTNMVSYDGDMCKFDFYIL